MVGLLQLAFRLIALLASGMAVLSIASLLALAAIPAEAGDLSPPARGSQLPSDQRQAELRNLLTQDCGSCHGLTLAGGLGPPLQPQALEGKPAEYLAATILYGRPGTAMPPWRPFLSDREAGWIADFLKRQVP